MVANKIWSEFYRLSDYWGNEKMPSPYLCIVSYSTHFADIFADISSLHCTYLIPALHISPHLFADILLPLHLASLHTSLPRRSQARAIKYVGYPLGRSFTPQENHIFSRLPRGHPQGEGNSSPISKQFLAVPGSSQGIY